jgi:thiol-disulfide isomerase/thioredoxin
MATSRSILSLALLTLGLIGCKGSSSAPPAESADPQSSVEPSAQPQDESRADSAVDEEKRKSSEAASAESPPGSATTTPPPSAKQDDDGRAAASTEIITVADAGAGSVGRDTQASPDPLPEPDPDEKTDEADERPALPKPIFGDTAKASCRKQLEVGNKLKSFKLASVDGKKTISSSSYRNRVVLVNFWATWCKPCIKELPDLDRLYRKYRSNGMTLVAIATDEEAAEVQKIVDDLKLAAKIAIGGEKAAGEYDHPNFPFSFVVDGDGKIVAAYDKVDESCLADLESVLRDELERLD